MAFKRFLNNADYLSIVTEEALSQLIRGNEDRLAQAEEAAEASVIEYLTDNYEVEKELDKGKNLLEYNPQVTYPVGAHFYKDHRIYEVIRTINGIKAPMAKPYWVQIDEIPCRAHVQHYSQMLSYHPGDIVCFANTFYRCLEYNGMAYNDIRIPGVEAWKEVEDIPEWAANYDGYQLWDIVKFEGSFYALIKPFNLPVVEEPETPPTDETDNGEGQNENDAQTLNDEPTEGEETDAPTYTDLTVNPFLSDNWGMIGDYEEDYEYEFSEHEYVVFDGRVFYPSMNVNADEIKDGFNIQPGDPRNANLKKHILRLAVYELHKLISPNNVSSARITDYETSIAWLRDASKLRINPQIPRKLDEDHKPVGKVAVATFMRDYDPYKNPWQI